MNGRPARKLFPSIPEGYRALPCGAVLTPAGRVAYIDAWALRAVHNRFGGAPEADLHIPKVTRWQRPGPGPAPKGAA